MLQDIPIRRVREASGTSPEESSFRRLDVVVYLLAGLFAIALVGALYAAKALIMPIVAALVIGTTFSAGASALQKYRIPHLLSTALLLLVSCGVVVLFIRLITDPLLSWMLRLPEFGSMLREKLHVFDGPLAWWDSLQSALGMGSTSAVPLPKIEWVQPTLDFLTPTLTEFLLFAATVVLFTMSWPNLRRSLILRFEKRGARLEALRILNEIEEQLGRYLLTVSLINTGVGVLTCLISMVAGLSNAPAIGALAGVLNYIPIIGPAIMLIILTVLGVLSASTLGLALIAPVLFAGLVFLEGHFVTPSIVGRGLSLNALAVLLAFAFWTWLWGPMGAFLSSPMLIVMLIVKEHLFPDNALQLPRK